MVHGYIHDKEIGDSLIKIDIDTSDILTGFNYNKENDILCLYNKTQNRFSFYSNIENLTHKNTFQQISNTYGKIIKIFARRNYIQSNAEYNRINFVYYVLSSKNQILKINIYYYLNENDRYDIRVVNVTPLDFEYESKNDFSCIILEKTDDHDMILHDPAFILYDNNKKNAYCSSVNGDEIIYIHELDKTDKEINENVFSLIEPNEKLNKSFLKSYPLISIGNKIIILFINFEKNILIRKISFISPFTNLFKTSCELNDYILKITGLDTETNEVKSYSIDLNDTEKKVKEEELNSKHDLSLNLFFNGGEYIRKDGDKIKVAIKSYNPSLQYPNKTQTLLKNLESVESDPIIEIDGEEESIPRIFEDDTNSREFMKEDITSVDTQRATEKNKIVKHIISNPRITGLLSQLNNLENETQDFEPIFENENSHIKLIRFKNNKISKTIYSMMYDGNNFGTELNKEYGAIIITDGKYIGETESDFVAVQLCADEGEKEYLTEPIFVRKTSDFNLGFGHIKDMVLGNYNKNIKIKDKENNVDETVVKSMKRKYE